MPPWEMRCVAPSVKRPDARSFRDDRRSVSGRGCRAAAFATGIGRSAGWASSTEPEDAPAAGAHAADGAHVDSDEKSLMPMGQRRLDGAANCGSGTLLSRGCSLLGDVEALRASASSPPGTPSGTRAHAPPAAYEAIGPSSDEPSKLGSAGTSHDIWSVLLFAFAASEAIRECSEARVVSMRCSRSSAWCAMKQVASDKLRALPRAPPFRATRVPPLKKSMFARAAFLGKLGVYSC